MGVGGNKYIVEDITRIESTDNNNAETGTVGAGWLQSQILVARQGVTENVNLSQDLKEMSQISGRRTSKTEKATNANALGWECPQPGDGAGRGQCGLKG